MVIHLYTVTTSVMIYDIQTLDHLHTIEVTREQWKKGIASLAFDTWHLVTGGM